MLSISNLLCDFRAGNESLRYGHVRHAPQKPDAMSPAGAPRPVVVWALTKACNLRCIHCYASASPQPAPGELSGPEALALLDDLAEFGVPAVLFSGGEPLVRPDALGLLAHARSVGLNCTLSTNGLLIDDAVADRLAELAVRYVGISLDGSEAKHDKLRRHNGAFAGSIAAINRCRKRGIKVGVRFTVHSLNESDLDAIFDACLANDVQRLCIYHLAYAGRGKGISRFDLPFDRKRALVRRIMHRTREAHEAGHALEVLTVGNHADAGYLLLLLEESDPLRRAKIEALLCDSGGNRSGCQIASIDPLGGVHYDQFSWHYECGNVRRRAFSQIWSEVSDARLKILRDRTAHLPRRCQNCRFLSICNGNLRSRAEAASGDWMGEDPACYLTDDEIARGTEACLI